MPAKLLTVSDVANLLQISERTVYDNAQKLGGFYPANIRVLRFPSMEDFLGDLERQKNQGMDLQVQISGQVLRRSGIANTPRSCNRKRKTPQGSPGIIKTDPSRHRL